MDPSILPLSTYESDPSFASLSPADKDAFYVGYFDARKATATNEDDYNSILKDDADRRKAALLTEYKSNFPDDTELDPNKLGEGFTMKYNDVSKAYNELAGNVTAPLAKVNLKNPDDPTRAFSYKPFSFEGRQGYTVQYPDGTVESVPGMEGLSQLTDFVKQNRSKNFKDQSEIDNLYDQVNNTESGFVQGKVNAFKKGWSGMLQGFDVVGITGLTDEVNLLKKEPDAAFARNQAIANDPNSTKEDREAARTAMDEAARAKPTNDSMNNREVNLAKQYSDLINEMQASSKINQDTPENEFQKYMAAQSKGDQNGGMTFARYFANKPSQILPYVASVVSSSLPDVGAAVGLGAAAGPVGAGAYGFAREYSATLLSEIQLAAAKDGTQLTDANAFDKYMGDEAFMSMVKTKATKRAGVIGVADAVLGGAVEHVLKSAKSGIVKTFTGATIGSFTEAGGELGAQLATEDKVNMTEVFNEGLGGLGAGPVVGAVDYAKTNLTREGAIQNRKERLMDKAKDKAEQIKPDTKKPAPAVGQQADEESKALEQDRLRAMIDNLTQDERNETDSKKAEIKNYSPLQDPTLTPEKQEAAAAYLATKAAPPVAEGTPVIGSDKLRAQIKATDAITNRPLKQEGDLPVIGSEQLRAQIPGATTQLTEEVTTPVDNTPRVMFRGQMRPYTTSISQNEDGSYRVRGLNIRDEETGMYETAKFPDGPENSFPTVDEAQKYSDSLVNEANQPAPVPDPQLTEAITPPTQEELSAPIAPVARRGVIGSDELRAQMQRPNPDPNRTRLQEGDIPVIGSEQLLAQMRPRNQDQLQEERAVRPLPAPPIVEEVTPEQEEDNFSESTNQPTPTFPEPGSSMTNTEKLLDMVARKFGFKRPAILTDEDYNRQQAAGFFTNNTLGRGIFELLKDRKSFDRIMTDARNSGYDARSQGNLMEAIGLTPNDTNRRVITNVLGDYWAREASEGAALPYVEGFKIGQAIDHLYRELFNVASYYDMDLGELEGINRSDILLNFAPDGMVTPLDASPSEYPLQSGNYLEMTNDEAIQRLEASLNATIVRNREYDPKLDNKYQEAKTLNRDNITVLKLDKLGASPMEIAENLRSAYGDRGFIMKDGFGANSVGIAFSTMFDSANALAEWIKSLADIGKLHGYYAESMVRIDAADSAARGNSWHYNEHRVHLYVDSDLQAHVFRNLTYNKKRSMYDLQDRMADADGNEDTKMIIADSPNDPVVAQLQEAAAKVMSNKPEFRDMIFGLDIAMASVLQSDNTNKFEPFVFEANALTYGMSGWLGRPLPMSEMLSEFTGKPSIMASMYEMAKLNMSAPQLTEVLDSVHAGMPSDYQQYRGYYDAISKGAAAFNRYLPVEKWITGMKKVFSDSPIGFLEKLWGTISGVFNRKIDPSFRITQLGVNPTLNENRQELPRGAFRVDGIQKGFGGIDGNDWVPMYQNVTITDATHPFDGSTLTIPLNGQTQLTEQQMQAAVDAKRKQETGILKAKAKKDLENTFVSVNSKKPITLKQYINQLLQHPQMDDSQRMVLQYILKNAGSKRLNGVKVQKTNVGYSNYNANKGVIGIQPEGTDLRIAIHEVMHAVTSDFIGRNHNNLATIEGLADKNDPSQMMGALYRLTEPANRGSMMNKGINSLYIDLAASYISFLESIGITREKFNATGVSPVGTTSDSSYDHIYQNESMPYGAISMDEYVAEAMSNDTFQQMLSKRPSLFSKTKSALNELFDMIASVLGLPFTKTTALSDAVTLSKGIIKHRANRKLFKDTTHSFNGKGIEILRAQMGAESAVRETAGILHLKDELPEGVKDQAIKSPLQSQREAASKLVAEEVMKARFDKMKRAFPDLLRGLDFNGSLAEAREKIIDHLDVLSQLENDKDGKEPSAKRIQAAIDMSENKALALVALKDLINHPAITSSQAKIMVDSMEYAMKKSSDIPNMTTSQIRYYANVFASLTDGGLPVGFKHIAARQFAETWQDEFNLRGLSSEDFSLPISDLRNKPFFGLGGAFSGGLSTQAAEINLIGKTRKAHKFLQDLMGTMKDQIDGKQLTEKMLVAEFYDHLKTIFPKGSFQPINDVRIGVIARLTQFQKGINTLPTAQIITRFNQLTESLPLMEAHDKPMYRLTKKALDDMIGTMDLTTLGDEFAIIAHLENQLTAAEKSVLYKIRDIGQRLLPSLQVVKAIAKKAVLDDWHNYVHDSSRTPKEGTEENSMSALNSLQDVLSERKGIDPLMTYPLTEISAIADHQIKASTYEQATGIERYILNSALDEKGPLSKMLDDGHVGRPISDRLRNLLHAYHNSMTRPQEFVNNFFGLIDSFIGAVSGTMTIGVNALTKNAASSTVARFNLLTVPGAIKHTFQYEMNRRDMDKFIKDNFPVQYDRTSEYDNIQAREQRYNVRGRARINQNLGDNLAMAWAKTIPYAPAAAIKLYSDTVLKWASNISNAIPERHNAFAIWTAHYINTLIQNGTVADAEDFMKRKPVDKRAATDASDFVTRSLGYAPDKAGKGQFWNGSSAIKRIMSKSAFAFRQQSSGLAYEVQNNTAKAVRLAAMGKGEEAGAAFGSATFALANAMAFRSMAVYLSSTMIWGGLSRFFKSDDDEEAKRAIMEAERKYRENSDRNNTRDFLTENITSILPVTTAAAIFENFASLGADHYGLVISGISEGDLHVEYKDELRDELALINEDLKKLAKVARRKEALGASTDEQDEEIEKLELAKSQLTEKLKFRYFTNVPDKAWLSAYGAYGFTAEKVIDQLMNFVKDDLPEGEKKEMRDMLDKEFTLNDSLAGAGFPYDKMKDASDFMRKFLPSDYNTPKNEKLPTALFWQSFLKFGENPGVVVERARQLMAEKALKEMKENDKRVKQIKSRFIPRLDDEEE